MNKDSQLWQLFIQYLYKYLTCIYGFLVTKHVVTCKASCQQVVGYASDFFKGLSHEENICLKGYNINRYGIFCKCADGFNVKRMVGYLWFSGNEKNMLIDVKLCQPVVSYLCLRFLDKILWNITHFLFCSAVVHCQLALISHPTLPHPHHPQQNHHRKMTNRWPMGRQRQRSRWPMGRRRQRQQQNPARVQTRAIVRSQKIKTWWEKRIKERRRRRRRM